MLSPDFEIRAQIEETTSDYDREKLQERLAKMVGGVAIINIGAATEEFVDMIKSGIIDPTKVARTALQNAASVAGLLITTESTVSELPKKEEPMPMPAGGGMDGMM